MTSNSRTQYPRDARRSAIALELEGYECEYNSTLKTFRNKSTGNNFLEAHHLIPISYHDQFNYDIDVPKNIVALNPTIHRQIRHGLDEDKMIILEKLFDKRQKN